MNILHIDSSISGKTSVSRWLSKETVARLVSIYPQSKVIHRDLAIDPPAHFVGANVQECSSSSRLLLDEFPDTDVVVVGAPFYNLSIPSQPRRGSIGSWWLVRHSDTVTPALRDWLATSA